MRTTDAFDMPRIAGLPSCLERKGVIGVRGVDLDIYGFALPNGIQISEHLPCSASERDFSLG